MSRELSHHPLPGIRGCFPFGLGEKFNELERPSRKLSIPNAPVHRSTSGVLPGTMAWEGRLKMHVACRCDVSRIWLDSYEFSRKWISLFSFTACQRPKNYSWRLPYCCENCYPVILYPALVAASRSDHESNSTDVTDLRKILQFRIRPFMVVPQEGESGQLDFRITPRNCSIAWALTVAIFPMAVKQCNS